MKTKLHNLDMKAIGDVELNEKVFGREVRRDILARAVNYQLNKRRAGTHNTKEIGEISGSTAKPWAQKGTGRARQGSTRSPQWRKGAVIFGPHPRSHATDMQKQVRKLALCIALSAKQADGKLFIIDTAKATAYKTKPLAAQLAKFGPSVLVIDGTDVDNKFALSLRNIKNAKMLPEQGANVYDILNHEALVLTQTAVEKLTTRLTAKATRGKAASTKTMAAKKAAPKAEKTAAKKPAAKKTAAKKAE